MSNWTIQNKSVTGETQWTNASYNLSFILPDNTTGQTDFIDIAGYTSGTISFTISPNPSGGGVWDANSTLEISIIGAIDGTVAAPVSSFTVQTLEIKTTDSGTTFYVEWNIPLQFVSLHIDNNTAISTGTIIRVTNIRLQTESEGGGVGFTSSSGATIGPGGATPQMQFNNGGVFGGTKNVSYDQTANIQGGVAQGQVQLGDTINGNGGTSTEPILAFANGAGDYNTGIFRLESNQIGISTAGALEVAITSDFHVSARVGSDARPSYNFGTNLLDFNTGMYRPVANAVGFSGNGIEQASIHSVDADPFMKGLNVGTPSNITGIRRLAARFPNSWEDGNCGNSEFIVFTATDFAGGFTNPLPPTGRAQTFVTHSTASASESPVVYNGANRGPAMACKLIPKGFIIDNANCFIYSDIATGAGAPQAMGIDVRVQIAAGPNIKAPLSIASASIGAASLGWQTAGDGSVNKTPINIAVGAATAAATGTGFNTINIFIKPTAAMSATTGGIVAFKVPIRRI